MQRQVAKSEADAIADLTKICQLVRIANGNLHRVAAAGAQILLKQLGSYPVLHRPDQRVVQMIARMILQPHQFRAEQLQAKRPAADRWFIGMRQYTAVAGKAEREPVIRAMQRNRQTLRMRDIDAVNTGKQGAQGG